MRVNFPDQGLRFGVKVYVFVNEPHRRYDITIITGQT